jgi:hypothetical protein
MVAHPDGDVRAEALRGISPLTRARSSALNSSGGGTGAGLLAAAIAIGASIRLYPMISSSGFPTGDGGLFFSMVRDLRANHLALPEYTSYNHGHIPFAYPPLGLYAAAVAQGVTHLSSAQIFAILPPVITTLSFLAFALLARSLLDSNLARITAVFAFALLPDAYFPERMGGGITRSFGLLLALLTLHQLVLLFRRPAREHLLLATLFAALTILSHLEWTLFTAYSGAVLWWALARSRQAAVNGLAVFLGTLFLSAPWWLTVVARHGVGPFVATLTNSSGAFPWYGGPAAFLGLKWTEELGFPLVTALAALGLVSCLASRRWLLPIWLAASFTIESRAYVQRPVIIIALLAGVGASDVLAPLVRRHIHLTGNDHRASVLTVGLLAFMAIYLLGSSLAWDATSTTQLSRADRDAMAWARTHTAADAQFFVVSVSAWGYTNPAEWFPALAERSNVSTVPGYEWIPGAIGRRTVAWNRALLCSSQTAVCIEHWLERSAPAATYVYIPRGSTEPGQVDVSGEVGLCCRPLRASLQRLHGYSTVYNRRGAEIFRRG